LRELWESEGKVLKRVGKMWERGTAVFRILSEWLKKVGALFVESWRRSSVCRLSGEEHVLFVGKGYRDCARSLALSLYTKRLMSNVLVLDFCGATRTTAFRDAHIELLYQGEEDRAAELLRAVRKPIVMIVGARLEGSKALIDKIKAALSSDQPLMIVAVEDAPEEVKRMFSKVICLK
jgi:hypothetical protein